MRGILHLVVRIVIYYYGGIEIGKTEEQFSIIDKLGYYAVNECGVSKMLKVPLLRLHCSCPYDNRTRFIVSTVWGKCLLNFVPQVLHFSNPRYHPHESLPIVCQRCQEQRLPVFAHWKSG